VQNSRQQPLNSNLPTAAPEVVISFWELKMLEGHRIAAQTAAMDLGE